MVSNNKAFLVQQGIKERLLDKLTAEQIKHLVAYVMDHIKEPKLQQTVIQLASMEIRNKKGAAKLAMHGIANILQLKNLYPEQIERIISDLESSGDIMIARKNIKRMLIDNQQEQLYFKSGGVKGEYYAYRDEREYDEESV